MFTEHLLVRYSIKLLNLLILISHTTSEIRNAAADQSSVVLTGVLHGSFIVLSWLFHGSHTQVQESRREVSLHFIMNSSSEKTNRMQEMNQINLTKD